VRVGNFPVKSNRKAQNGKLLSMKELAKFMKWVGNGTWDCGALPRKGARSYHR
jgi:hypothetical protein